MNKIVSCILCVQVFVLTVMAGAHPEINPAAITDRASVTAVVVIGGGPAGYAAGLYCARAGFDTIVFEGPLPGGQLMQTGVVENWPGVKRARGMSIMEGQRQQVIEAGARVLSDTVVSLDCAHWPFEIKTQSGLCVRALTVVVATGSTPKMLRVPGEQEYFGRGVSICAVCDAWAYNDKNVVVIGGGDSAAEEALQLASHAREVTVLVRGEHMRAGWTMLEKLRQTSNIKVEFQKEVVRVCGDQEGVTGVQVHDIKTKITEHRAIDGIFLAIGHLPNNQLLRGHITLDEHGCVALNGRSQATSVSGVFAAGEIADPVYRQAATAAGDGHKAGRDVERCLYGLGLTPQVVRSWKVGA